MKWEPEAEVIDHEKMFGNKNAGTYCARNACVNLRQRLIELEELEEL
jgi:hypothetical protein